MADIKKLDKPKSEIVNEALSQYIRGKTKAEACIQPVYTQNSEPEYQYTKKAKLSDTAIIVVLVVIVVLIVVAIIVSSSGLVQQ